MLSLLSTRHVATGLTALAAAIGGSAAASAGELGPTDESPVGENGPVRLAGSSWVADAPTKIAEALGFFDDPDGTGPPIEVSYHDSGKEALAAVLTGKAEYALAAPSPLASALLSEPGRSRQPVILASIALSNRTHVVVADRRRGIAVPADLAGRRVGLLGGTSAHYVWERFASLHGLEPDAEVVDAPVSSLPAAVRAGEVTAAVLWDPWATLLERELGDDAAVFSTRGLHSVDWLLVGLRPQIRAAPGVADRILGGLLRAVDLIHREPERALRLHASRSDATLERLAALEERVIWNVNLGWSVLANMDAQFRWLDAGAARPRLGEYLDPSVLDRLAPERNEIPLYLSRGGRPDAPATPDPGPAGGR